MEGAGALGAITDLPRLEQAIERARAGETVVVLIESSDGSATGVVDLLSDSVAVHARVDCALACRALVGGVADDLRLEEFSGGAIVIEDAQWADPTSMGRLQRLVKEGDTDLLLLIAHRPISGIDGWWIDQLAKTAADTTHLVQTEVTAAGAGSESHLDGPAADIVAATNLVAETLSVSLAARLTSLNEEETMALGERLVADGYVVQQRTGYTTAPNSESSVGEARLGHVASRLADLLQSDDAPASLVGNLRLAAGDNARAFELLYQAAVEADERHASGEAFHLAEAALEASETLDDISPQDLGTLHLICGRFLRVAGRTDWATSHLDQATTLLVGVQRVDALALAASLADDAQHPQDAERIISQAEWQATTLALDERLGALYTFRARVLNRIGYPMEADVVLDKSLQLLTEESPEDRYEAHVNRAWIYFDRGESRKAETEFALLADQARQSSDLSATADNLAWRSRALFASGRPAEALEAISEVENLSASSDLEAPVFLTQLALTEGGIAYGSFDTALDASEHVLDLVERQLPAWENMARCLRAQALYGLGRLDDAQAEIDKALTLSPPGANGWRWRTRCTAIALQMNHGITGRISGDAAEDLADLLLQSRLYGWAAELLCAIAESGLRRDAASEALAIATQIGQPMLAARAARAGDLWHSPEAGPTINHLRHIHSEIPERMRDAWMALPQVQEGLDAPEPETHSEDLEAAAVAMDESLERAGLTGDEILSPAQRRTRGYVRRPRARRRPLMWVAAALGVVLVAAGTAFAVSSLTSSDPPSEDQTVAATTAPPTTSVVLGPAETLIAIDNERGFLFGTAIHRGGPERTGYVEVDGPTNFTGLYWETTTSGALTTSPIAFGQQLFVGTDTGTFYIFDQSTGDFRTITASGIDAAPALGEAAIEGAEDSSSAPAIIVFVDDDGVAHAHQAGIAAFTTWSTPLDTGVTSSPIIHEGYVYVAGTDGIIHVLEVVEGEEVARWPADETTVGPIRADLTLSDGLLYVASGDGHVYVLDVQGRELTEVCRYDTGSVINLSPIVDEGIVHVTTTDQRIWMFPEGNCEGRPSGRLSPLTTETSNDIPPAIVGGVMYIAEGTYLYATNLNSNVDLWDRGLVDADSTITSAPVVTSNAVYFADEAGTVYAIDSATGSELWRFDTGLTVRGDIAVVGDAVFVVSENGNVYALGDGPPVSDE